MVTDGAGSLCRACCHCAGQRFAPLWTSVRWLRPTLAPDFPHRTYLNAELFSGVCSSLLPDSFSEGGAWFLPLSEFQAEVCDFGPSLAVLLAA